MRASKDREYGGIVEAGIPCYVGKPAVAFSVQSRVFAQLLIVWKERLPPQGAVQKLNERVKKIGKVNSEIADWLQVEHTSTTVALGQD